MAVSRAVLKSFFETGDIPTEAEFASLIDSILSLIDDSNLKDGIKIKSATDGKIEIIFDDGFYQFTTDGGSFGQAFFRGTPNDMRIGFGGESLRMSSGFLDLFGSDVLFIGTLESPVEIKFDSNGLSMFGLRIFADNAAAIAGGLINSNIYKTATGEMRIVV